MNNVQALTYKASSICFRRFGLEIRLRTSLSEEVISAARCRLLAVSPECVGSYESFGLALASASHQLRQEIHHGLVGKNFWSPTEMLSLDYESQNKDGDDFSPTDWIHNQAETKTDVVDFGINGCFCRFQLALHVNRIIRRIGAASLNGLKPNCAAGRRKTVNKLARFFSALALGWCMDDALSAGGFSVQRKFNSFDFGNLRRAMNATGCCTDELIEATRPQIRTSHFKKDEWGIAGTKKRKNK